MHFAPARVEREDREGGGFVLRSPDPLGPFAARIGDWLDRWAREAPARTFLAEREARGATEWRTISYAEAQRAVRAIAQGLLDLGAGADKPALLLSDNGVDHALVQLAAMHAGVPAAPVSPAYALASRDFAKLREIVTTVGPGVVFADDLALFGKAIAVACPGVPVLSSRGGGAATVSELRTRSPGEALARANDATGPATIAKILFTSGSTGSPKGVVNTHRMLCSNQQAIAQVWPLLAARPPVVVDWLPWSHTFGGNHNFNMVLASGGTLYVDGGKPAPGRFEETIANLRDVSPTLYFNVPRGFERLAEALEGDASLAERFFAELDLLFYAAAALPQSTWVRLEQLAAKHRPGKKLPFVAAWGSTETSPLVTSVHFPIARAGVIGLPAPGCELKFVRAEGDAEGQAKLEMRVRGPNVAPGYWERGGTVKPIALDNEGFLPTGDAGRLEDERDPARGVVFDGRTGENFKLSSGTWVTAGELRVRAITACAPLVQDAVVAGHDRDCVTLLLFLAPTELPPDELRARLARGLEAHNAANDASSTRVARALVLEEPPSIDGGEITDKGYINQRAVLTRRAAFVERLYAAAPDDAVLVIDARS